MGKIVFYGALLLSLLGMATTSAQEVDFDKKMKEYGLVDVQSLDAEIRVELKYATSSNFTGEVIYDFTEVYLRYSTVLKLMEVQAELREQGLTTL